MTCSDFIQGFSDYVDGVGDPEQLEAACSHVERCASCRGYEETYRRGVQLLRSFSDLTVRDGFEPELDRRIREETAMALESLGRRSVSSGSSMTMLVGMALILVGAAWSPLLFSRVVQVELSPIQAAAPRARAPMVGSGGITLLPERRMRPRGELVGLDLWDEPSSLLRQYAPVLRGYPAGGVRLGLD
ncbi:MAG: hypothetical protein P8188_08985 [Gemmatimonadota bacterium]|jgi:anti-sigma factor RsiW